MTSQTTLFDLAPVEDRRSINYPRIRNPVWTRDKAQLIERYLHLFVMVTKHGVYIDGFAGPQRRNEEKFWAAKQVLESEPRRLRSFLLVDAEKSGYAALQKLKERQPYKRDRTISVFHGDFNLIVDDVLNSSGIKERTASFCLLDQRTFECNWETVRKISRYKKNRKIEIFYFLGTGWLDREISGLKDPRERLGDWWGIASMDEFLKQRGSGRARFLAQRFRDELGYMHATPWPIYGQGHHVMYHMIHASDHQEAPNLMRRSYKRIAAARTYRSWEQFELKISNRQTTQGKELLVLPPSQEHRCPTGIFSGRDLGAEPRRLRHRRTGRRWSPPTQPARGPS